MYHRSAQMEMETRYKDLDDAKLQQYFCLEWMSFRYN